METSCIKWASKACFALVSACLLSSTLSAAEPTTAEKYKMKLNSAGFAQEDQTMPRTLDGYVRGADKFFDLLIDKHPMFKYEKEGRLVGKYTMSDRMEEFVEINSGPKYAKKMGLEHAAVTYRLGWDSILDYPNKFVGPKKCGECHPAQYTQWARSRHAKTVRHTSDIEEVNNDLKKPVYSAPASILPLGIEAQDVFAIIGTPRTKYGFIDKWLVRGTYHVQDGNLSDLSGKMVAGGNQFSRVWAENITPEVAKKIAEFSPGFPTKMEEFAHSRSTVWGTNSYGSKYAETMMFQPASSYCEICHPFKFDFKTQDEFFAAIGDKQKLEQHTISLGISCEECHGAGAHLYGARGAGMASNCERCHQRFAYHDNEAEPNPRKPFNVYFKSSCPSCGTEGSQMYSSAHYDKGMRCSTCHDPHEVTANNWKDGWTRTGLKKTCSDCHETQADFFKQGGIHSKDNCTGCHMPNMMSCENFAAIQNPDKGGFDNVRASHIWNIKVDKTAKSINPPAGKERDPLKTKGWRMERDENGRFFLDLMWSCGRTSFSDPDLMAGPNAAGCHSAVQSTLPKNLHYTNQEMIYDAVMKWQTPVKDGFAKISDGIKKIDKSMANSNLSSEKKVEVITLTKQAQSILEKLQKDGSWGVHGPAYSKKLVDEALVYIDQAQNVLNGKK